VKKVRIPIEATNRVREKGRGGGEVMARGEMAPGIVSVSVLKEEKANRLAEASFGGFHLESSLWRKCGVNRENAAMCPAVRGECCQRFLHVLKRLL
jgi:hypothetical protein